MSSWFKDRRQEFITATFRQFGQLRRADIMREFDITQASAAHDIGAFLAANPGYVRYDVSAKTYVLADEATKAGPSIKVLVERVGYALWRDDAERAAPNVAKFRTIEAYREGIKAGDLARFERSARAAIKAMGVMGI